VLPLPKSSANLSSTSRHCVKWIRLAGGPRSCGCSCHSSGVDSGDDTYAKSEAAGRSLDQARAMYEDTYNGDSFVTDRSEKEFSYRYTSTGNDDMTLRSSTFLGSIQGSLVPKDEYIVAWITDGAGAYDIDDQDLALEHGKPVVFPTGKQFSFDMVDYRQNLVHFKAGYLEQVAAEHEGALAGPLVFDPLQAPAVQDLRRWQQTIGTAAKTILGSEPSPLLHAEINRMTAITMLDTFAHTVTKVESLLLAPRNARLREAVEYIHVNARLPISTTDIAKAASLSPRGLQQAFARQLEISPTEYLRSVRLDHVRAVLTNMHPEAGTVADVARDWGFVHLSRFSASYAEKFGEYPSDTLRR
jgi:AraC-like DNA-binding protein